MTEDLVKARMENSDKNKQHTKENGERSNPQIDDGAGDSPPAEHFPLEKAKILRKKRERKCECSFYLIHI